MEKLGKSRRTSRATADRQGDPWGQCYRCLWRKTNLSAGWNTYTPWGKWGETKWLSEIRGNLTIGWDERCEASVVKAGWRHLRVNRKVHIWGRAPRLRCERSSRSMRQTDGTEHCTWKEKPAHTPSQGAAQAKGLPLGSPAFPDIKTSATQFANEQQSSE